ncbi:MAG: M14 family metallopeptidase [Candidatus Saccharicenans sp.]|nr:M14 family metallopeptidase [Candidatus Saccharicenans sp.]
MEKKKLVKLALINFFILFLILSLSPASTGKKPLVNRTAATWSEASAEPQATGSSKIAPKTSTLPPNAPLTVAESSQYTATSYHAEVISFINELQKLSPNLVVENIGTSAEGRSIPMLIISNPPVHSPLFARYLNKTVIYIQANIHAGEVEGKEASLMLARELVLNPAHPYLQNLVILIVPDLNPDGNDKINPKNRLQQPGPEKGVGVRPNGQNLDLNRDAIKLESPEMRAVVSQIINRWDPALVLDLHTTDGAYHEETVTYSWPVNPNIDPELLAYQRDVMLPAIVKNLKDKYGTLAAPYGMFRDWRDPAKGWETFEPQPRYFTNYAGLRNRLSILDENYVHADYKTRVISCFNFLKAILDYASVKATDIQKLIEAADRRTVAAGLNPAGKTFAVEFDLQPLPKPITIQAYELEVTERPGGGFPQIKPTDRKKPVTIPYYANYVPQKTVNLPYGYLISISDPSLVAILLEHGLLVEQLTAGLTLEVEVFKPKEVKASDRPFQGHRLEKIKGEYKKEARTFPAGSLFIRCAQPLGYLAAYLLEPESDDGLAVWNFFDRYLYPEWQRNLADFPVYRLLEPVNLQALRITN